MSRIRSKDTKPELIVRRRLHSLGYRYRLHRKDLPGKPDIVFAGRRKVIFIHGCFWHAHGCKISHRPKTNEGYWSPKLQRNVDRDQRNIDALKEAGWDVLTLWECEIISQPLEIMTRAVEFLRTALPLTGDLAAPQSLGITRINKRLPLDGTLISR